MDDLDHRALGAQLDLFHFREEAPGMAFWHPRGFAVYRAVEEHVRRRIAADGYREVRSPMVLDRSLWERSGHWDMYGAHMFSVPDGDRDYAVKPMNCPGHILIFGRGLRSWRDLPLRYAEFGAVHRNEPSGALHGLLRLRSFVQDDGHIFCREDQIGAEVDRFCTLVRRLYADFGFGEVDAALSLRPAARAGSDAVWDRAEGALAEAARAAGLDCRLQPGEGAFYGPKLEFSLLDRRGRRWQCGTLQVDFVLAGRLGVDYVAEDGGREAPVILHRAALGSIERFVGILLEHHGGDLPLWLAPEQVLVAAVSERHAPHARRVAAALESAGLRVAVDDGPGRMSRKAMEARLRRVPVLAVVGDREAADDAVSVRRGEVRLAAPLAEAVPVVAGWAAAP